MLGPRILKPWIPLMAILLTVAVIASGCGGGDAESGTADTDAGSADIVMEVVQDEAVLASFLLADLRGLPQVTVKTGSTERKGPTLRSVLAAAGVEEFDSVNVDGFLQGRGLSVDLTNTDVDDEILLVLNSQGKARLVGPDLAPKRSIADVTRLTVS
tara:strand:+ start:563 stop:1033 length:471 start_codon:yes stop_codon:yes gene_type:complete